MTTDNNADRLSWSQRWFAIRALLLLQGIALAVRVFGFTPVHRWLSSRTPRPVRNIAAGSETAYARQVGDLVGLANRRFPVLHATCLPESLTVWWLLRRQGVSANLRLGVRNVDGALDGHAWVEIDNQVVSGDPNQALSYLTLNLSDDP